MCQAYADKSRSVSHDGNSAAVLAGEFAAKLFGQYRSISRHTANVSPTA
jgi:hypothetical protein